MLASHIMPATCSMQSTLDRFLMGELPPIMHTVCIFAGGIDIAPSVALTTASVKVGIPAIASIRVVCKMPTTITLALGAGCDESSTVRSTNLHTLKCPRVSMIPVSVGYFVLHALRITSKGEYLKVFFSFLFAFIFQGFS